MMTKGKSKSPREILSRFDDVVRQKKNEGQSSTDDLSIFDVVATPEENNAQGSAAMGAPQQRDYAEPQGPEPNPQTPRLSKPKPPSWKLAETARDRQRKSDSTMKTTGFQNLSQQTGKEIRNKLFTRKLGVSSVQQKAMMALIPVLLIVLIFLLARSLLAPTDAGGEASRLIVKGILSDRDNPSAIVNNQIVHEGDNISGATVIKINRDSVEFEVRRRWPRKSRLLTRKVQH